MTKRKRDTPLIPDYDIPRDSLETKCRVYFSLRQVDEAGAYYLFPEVHGITIPAYSIQIDHFSLFTTPISTEISIEKFANPHSAALHQAFRDGTVFQDGRIIVMESVDGGFPRQKIAYKFSGVVVTGIQQSVSTGGTGDIMEKVFCGMESYSVVFPGQG